MPELSRPCNQTVECEHQWFSSQWSKCSVECGQGVQTRNVLCGKFDKNGVTPAEDESKCEASEKPENSKVCDTGKECEGQWFTGPWSDCNKPCGSGKRSRKVLCIANGKLATKASLCGEDSVAFPKEECNTQPCVDDEWIPVDTTSKPIEEDDEGEDWCPDDDDGEGFEIVSSTDEIDTTTNESTSETEFDSSSSPSSLSTDDDMLSDSTYSSDETSSDTTDLFCMIIFLLN